MMLRRITAALALAALLLWPSAPPANAVTSWYVSPSGSGSGCTIVAPCSLAFAIGTTSPAAPGDTVWLRGGTYPGIYTGQLNGTAGAPIVVRQYPGERATIDGGAAADATFSVGGSYTWYWGFEVMSSAGHRTSTETGSWPSDIPFGEGVTTMSDVNHPGLKFINMIVHDQRQGFSLWTKAIDSELYGNLIYYHGWTAPDRGHGHGIYTQNQTGTKTIKDNIIFGNFSHGIQAYSSVSGSLNNFRMEGNTSFSNESRELLLGGSSVVTNGVVTSNYLYRYNAPLAGSNFDLGYDPAVGCLNTTVTNNYVADGVFFGGCSTAQGLVMTGNTFYGYSVGLPSASYPSNTYFGSVRPTGIQVFVRPNTYEAGRGNVTVFNWALASTVSVNLSTVLTVGQAFEVRNAQNFYGTPALTGTYAGGSVTLPMTGLIAAAPVGWPKPAEAGPEFAVFVVLPAASAGTSTPTATPTLTPTAIPPTATPTRTPTRTPTPTPTWTNQVRDKHIKTLESVVYTPTPTP